MKDTSAFTIQLSLVVIYWGLVAPHTSGFFIGLALIWGFYFLGRRISGLMDASRKNDRD